MHWQPGKTVCSLGLGWLLLGCYASIAVGQFAARDGFEGPEPAWRDVGGDPQYRIELRQRTPDSPHSGNGCEHLRLLAGNGTYVHVAYDVEHAPIIDEFQPSVWVRADRPGVRLLVRAVLPRTQDPRTGQPMIALLAGDSYRATGRWEQLRTQQATRLLERAARNLRQQHGATIDTRQAFVDQVLLNIYSGPGRANVWIDDLEVAGLSQPWPHPTGTAAAPIQGVSQTHAAPAEAAQRVEFRGKVLLVNGHPFFPRMIQYQGEPLAELKQRGLNAVMLSAPPTPAVLEDAAQSGMWLVAPPPAWTTLDDTANSADERLIGPEYGVVLAWTLGEKLKGSQVEVVRQWAKTLRRADRLLHRPLVCGADSQIHQYSRIVDAMLLGRLPLAGRAPLAEHADWIAERARRVAPGRPVWVTVQTQAPPSLLRQQTLIAGVEPPGGSVSAEQIRLLVYQSLAAEARGICYQSNAPLRVDSPAERRRALAVEMMNLEMELIESWVAGGNLTTAIDTDQAEIRAAVIGSPRARLLLPIWCDSHAQFVPGPSAGSDISFKVPGVPSSHDVFELTPVSLRPLRHQRVTGGTRILLDEFGLTATVLMTGDPLVVNSLRGRSSRLAARAARVQRDLAAHKLDAVRRTHALLATAVSPPPQAAAWLASAAADLEQCDLRLAQGDHRTAHVQARRSTRSLRLLERAYWDQVVGSQGTPAASPLAGSFSTLGEHLRMIRHLRVTPPGENRLPAGDLENLTEFLNSGWRHQAGAHENVTTLAELAPRAARSGRFGLRMVVSAADPRQPVTLIDATAVSIRSAPVVARAGQWVLIQGWVKIPQPLSGNLDGLVIVDSLGGEELAQSIVSTNDWRPFEFYRVAPQADEVTVTFAMRGIGEAWIDDVQIRMITAPNNGAIAEMPRTVPRVTPLPPVR